MKVAFHNHGTKFLGSAVAGIAALQLCRPQFDILLSEKGLAWFDIATSFTLAVLGVWTVQRGFSNTKNSPSPDTHDDGTAASGDDSEFRR